MDGLTPEQIAENDRIQKLPVIIDLAKGQAQIIDMIKEDKEQNKTQFDEGSVKFKELWDEVKEVRSEVTEMKGQIKDGFNDVTTAIKNKENDELKAEIKGLKKVKDKDEERSFTMKSGLFLIVATIILTAIFTNLPKVTISSKDLNVNPPTSNQIERIQTNH